MIDPRTLRADYVLSAEAVRIIQLTEALEWISIHDLTGEAGCRRAQLVATDALRYGLTPEQSIAKHKEKQDG